MASQNGNEGLSKGHEKISNVQVCVRKVTMKNENTKH